MATSCAAYSKPSCWLPVVNGSVFCATCQSQSDRDALERFIAQIPVLPLDEIVPNFQSRDVQRSLRTHNTAVMDRMLAALYRRSKLILVFVLDQLKASKTLRANLLLRIRGHTRPDLCAVFGYMVRKGLYPEWLMPRCLTCLSHMIRYTNDPNFPLTQAPTLRKYLDDPNTVQIVRQVLANRLNGETVCLDFLGALAETRVLSMRLRQHPFWLTTIQNLMRQLGIPQQQINSFIHRAHNHPLLLQLTQHGRTFLKDRMAPWKEELTAKGWHPCRFTHWCLDEDEKKEFADGGCSLPPYHSEARPAAWNISWI